MSVKSASGEAARSMARSVNRFMVRSGPRPLVLALLGAWLPAAQSQTPVQVVKPPQAQAWIDVATYSGFGMPGGMGGMGGAEGGNPMAMLGGLFGGGAGKGRNSFGNTQAGQAGRWVDVTVYSRTNPNLAEALQAVPAGFMVPALKLQVAKPKPGSPVPPAPEEDTVSEPPTYEKPKGRLLMYWGCGTTVRPGQPKVLDMAQISPADMAAFFVSRRATQRGAHSAPGRPIWPGIDDTRMVPAQASLVGEHAFSGSGIPEGFKFNIGAGQDLMPALAVQQATPSSGGTLLSWAVLPTARAYFLSGMGAGPGAPGGGDSRDMVFWTSSEVPETGTGLMDYQTNPAVDRWLKEKVLLAPATSQCQIPKGVFQGEGAMVRMIAYGSELNLVHPPRPTDPKVAWEQVWAAKLRVKSMTTVLLGMTGMTGMSGMPGMGSDASAEAPPAPAEAAASTPDKSKDNKAKAIDLLKGLLGR